LVEVAMRMVVRVNIGREWLAGRPMGKVRIVNMEALRCDVSGVLDDVLFLHVHVGKASYVVALLNVSCSC